MDQNVKPFTAFIILCTSISLISLIFWMRSEALSVGGPGHIQQDNNKNSVIHIADKLYRVSPTLELLETYDLPKLGVYDMVGDFAFFSNGDILIRKGRYQPSFLESIAHYLRITETKPATSNQDDEGLFRCNLKTNQCFPFGTEQLDFDSAFHLSIDTVSNTVYISDTSRHKLRKYDKHGNELAVIDKGFKFPNQNRLINDQLLIADTNHHAIEAVNIQTEHFGEISATHPIDNPILKQNSWPYSFSQVGKDWWVNTMGSNMSQGIIAVYDENWAFVKTLSLPDQSDPFDFAVLENQILITDFDNSTLYQLDFEGNHLKQSLPKKITLKLAQVKENRMHYMRLSYGAVFIFAAFLILGFVIAVIQQRKQTVPELLTPRPIEIDINDPNIKWLAFNKKKINSFKWLVILSLLLIAIALLTGNIRLGLIILSSVLLVTLILFIAYSKKLGTLDDVLIIKYMNKKYSAGKQNSIYFSDKQIVIGSLFISFYSQQLMHDTEQVVKEIMPTLRYATYIPPRQMMRMVLKRQNPILIALLLLLVALATGEIMLEGITL